MVKEHDAQRHHGIEEIRQVQVQRRRERVSEQAPEGVRRAEDVICSACIAEGYILVRGGSDSVLE